MFTNVVRLYILLDVYFDGFDWDKGNIKKIVSHGLALDEIEDFFLSSPIVFDDARHSHDEDRHIATGSSSKNGKLVFVCFTIRILGLKILIRPISARYMREKEAKAYEKFNKDFVKKKT